MKKEKVNSANVDITTGEILSPVQKWYTTQRSYIDLPVDVITEKNNGISMTIPNDTFSLREIMLRYASGLPINGMKIPQYHGDQSIPMDLDNWKKMDIAERYDYIKAVKKRKEELEGKIKDDAQRQINARRDAELLTAVENELKKRELNKPKETNPSPSDGK